MWRNKVFFVLGFALSLLGAKIFVDPRYYNPIYRRELDFTGYNAPLGILLLIVGVFFILTTLQKKREAGRAQATLLICPKCETTLAKEKHTDPTCPQCMSEMEELEGFYERHPELKTREDSKNDRMNSGV